MQGYQEHRGYHFGKNTHLVMDHRSSTTSASDTQQCSNSHITWTTSSTQTATINNCSQSFNQTSFQHAELAISQNVEEEQQFTQSPALDIIPPSPYPTSPISSHWPTLDRNSLFPDFSSFCCLPSPTSSQYPSLLTPHPCPISPSSSQCSTVLPSLSCPTSQTSSPGPTLPTSSACPISSASGPIVPPFSFPSTPLIPENINDPHVSPHNQSSHDQQAKMTFPNYGQAIQLLQPMQSSILQVGNRNTINSIAMATVMPVTSSLKQEDLLSKPRDRVQPTQLMENTPVSQIHQINLQFSRFNSDGYQHSNEMQQNTSLREHQNPQSVQCNLQTHQQNSESHQQNQQITQQNYMGSQQNLPENPPLSQQNAQIYTQSQQKPLDPISFHQQPQQTLETYQQILYQSENSHNQLYAWQNLQTNLQNVMQPQQNLQTNLQNVLQPQQNLQTNLQNVLQPQQNLQTNQQNVLQPQQNLQTNKKNKLPLQTNLQINQQNVLPLQTNLQINQQNVLPLQTNLQINQQNVLPLQTNLQINQQNVLPLQTNLQINQQDTRHHQQNFLSDQRYLCEPQPKLQISQQSTMQHQENLQINLRNPYKPEQTLHINEQNAFLTQQNLHKNQQNTLQPQQNLLTNQQNPCQPQQNLKINLQNTSQPQHSLWTDQQHTFQVQQHLQINQQNALQPQHALWTHQQNPYQPQQNLQINHQNPYQPEQNLQINEQNTLHPHQNLQTDQQNTLLSQQNLWTNQQNQYQSEQNLRRIQQNPYQSQQNNQINQQNILQPQLNLQINHQNLYQSQQNHQINEQNTLQPQQNLDINQQNTSQSQQNVWTNQQNLYQPQQNLQTIQQNQYQPQQNKQINQQNILQPQQSLQMNQQNVLQSQQNLQINQQNTLQLQQNLLSNQQNPWQSQQNIQLNQQNPWQPQQNLVTDLQNTLQLQQSILTHQKDPANQNPYQSEQNLQKQQNVWPPQNLETNQSCSDQVNFQTNENNIWKTEQNIQNHEHALKQESQHSMHRYNQKSGEEFSTQQTQTASNLYPLDRDISLNCAAASISHQSGKVQKQMSSHMLPERAVQTGQPTSSNSTELLKYFVGHQKKAMEKENLQIPSQLSCWLGEFITQQLFPRQQSLVNIDYMDIQNNQQYSQFLQELSILGGLATSDLKKLEKNQWPHKSMSTDKGSDCGASSRTPMETGQDMPAEEEQPLSQENKWDDLIKSADICHQKVTTLASTIKQMALEWFEDIKECNEICKYHTLSDECKKANVPNSYANHAENLTRGMNNKIGCNSPVNCLSDVCGCLIDFMEKWKCLEAWKYVQLTLTPDDATVKTKYDDFGAMYTTYFDCLSVVESRIISLQEIFLDARVKSNICETKKELYKIKFKLLSVSWFYEKQPPTCSLPSEEKDLHIRVFGVTQSDIDEKNSQIYVFPQAYYENRIQELYLCNEKESSIKYETCQSGHVASKQEVGVVANILARTNCKRRSNCFEQMYRICLVIKLKSSLGQDIEPQIECCSLPFALRTGSSQLWEFEGAIMWYCYFEHNLSRPSQQFTQMATIDQVVHMLQAVIGARDPQRILDKHEILSLKAMLKSVCKRNEISLREFVHVPLNGHEKKGTEQERQPAKQRKQQSNQQSKHGRQLTKEGKQPTKQGNKSTRVGNQPRDTCKKNSFSFFIWFMATINSYMFLKSCKMSGSCFFLNQELCPAPEDVPDGSALIRASRSSIEGYGSQKPYAHLTIHIYSGKRAVIARVPMELTLNAKPQAFIDWLGLVKDENNVPMIRTILPQKTPIEEFKDSSNDEGQTNDYRTRYKELPKSTIILQQQFGEMSLYSDLPNLAKSNG